MISVVDPDARHVHKSVHARQDGYKAHVATEPDTGLFTAAKLAKATGAENHKAAVGLQLLDAELSNRRRTRWELLGDSAYGVGEARAALAAAGHTAVIKPAPLRPAAAGGFTLDDFTVDEAAATVTCPNGITRRISAKRNVTFGVACRGCPLQQRCTTAQTGRTLILHLHDALLRRARRDWATDVGLRATYRRHRPMVERSIASLIGPYGRCRKLRYRGVAANNAWSHTRMAEPEPPPAAQPRPHPPQRGMGTGLRRRPGPARALARPGADPQS